MFLKSFFRHESELSVKEQMIQNLQNEVQQTKESSSENGEQLSGNSDD